MTAQGWCPSTFRLFDASDGGLARVKVPGGILGLDQIEAVADGARRYGNGTVEITSRANLQIRGVDPEWAADLRSLLAPVGLSAPTAEIDDRRNVLASPTAGLAPDELVDVRTSVQVVTLALDSIPDLGALPHKFGMLLDGAGAPTLRGRELDLALGAVLLRDGGGSVAFELALGAALPLLPEESDDPVRVVPVSALTDVAVAATRLCAGHHPGIPAARMADIVGAVGLAETLTALRLLGGHPVDALPADQVVRTVEAADAPLGTFAALAPGGAYIGVAPSKAVTPEMLDDLAGTLRRYRVDDVRLTPWRSIVVPVDGAVADDLLAQLTAAGWTTEAPADLVGATE